MSLSIALRKRMSGLREEAKIRFFGWRRGPWAGPRSWKEG